MTAHGSPLLHYQLFREDPVIKEIIASFGTAGFEATARETSWQVSNEVAESEAKLLALLIERQQAIVNMQQQLDTCLSTLESLGGTLNTFGQTMTGFMADVGTLQRQSENANCLVQRQRDLHIMLTAYVDRIVVTPELANTIKTGAVESHAFGKAIEEMQAKLFHAEEPGLNEYPSGRDSRAALYDLRCIAVERCRDALSNKVRESFSGQNVNLFVMQQVIRNQMKSLYTFLSNQSPMAAQLVQQQYVNYAQDIHWKQLRTYTSQMERVTLKMCTRDNLIQQLCDMGCVPEALNLPSNNFTNSNPRPVSGGSRPGSAVRSVSGAEQLLHERLTVIEDFKHETLPMAGERRFPEEIFRSVLKRVSDSALTEWNFVTEFFFGDDPNTPLGQERFDQSVPLYGDQSPMRLFEKVFLKSQLLCKDWLEKECHHSYDTLALGLMWRIVDAFEHAVPPRAQTALSAPLHSLQVAVCSHLGRVLEFVTDAYEATARATRQGTLQPELFSTALDTRASRLPDFFTYMGMIYASLASVLSQGPPNVSQASLVAGRLTRIRELLEETLPICTSKTEKSESQFETKLRVLASLEVLSQQLESTKPLIPVFAEDVSHFSEWLGDQSRALMENVGGTYLDLVCSNLHESVRLAEQYAQEGQKIPGEVVEQLCGQLSHQEQRWQNDLTQIKEMVDESGEFGVSEQTQEVLLQLAYAPYVLLHTRLLKACESLCTARHEGDTLEELKVLLAGVPPAHVLLNYINPRR